MATTTTTAQDQVRGMVMKALWSAEGVGGERAGWGDAWAGVGDASAPVAAAAAASPAAAANPPAPSDLETAAAFPWLCAAVEFGDVQEAARVQQVLGGMVTGGQPQQPPPPPPQAPPQQQQHHQPPPPSSSSPSSSIIHAPGGPLALPPIALAAKRGDVAMLRALARGPSLNADDVSPATGMSALSVAVAAGKPEIVRELLSPTGAVKADPNARLGPAYGPAPCGTALHAAVTALSPADRARTGAEAVEQAVDDALQALLQAPSVDLEATDALGTTAVLLAAWYAREHALKILLDKGASPAALDKQKRGALGHLLSGAAAFGVGVRGASERVAAIERMTTMLLEKGAPAHAGLDDFMMCPVFYAAAIGSPGALKLLLAAPEGRLAHGEVSRDGSVLHFALGGPDAGDARLPAAWHGTPQQPAVGAPPSRAELVKLLLPPPPRRDSWLGEDEGPGGGVGDEGGGGADGEGEQQQEEQGAAAAAAPAPAAAAPVIWCDPNVADSRGRTPAYVAVMRGDVASLRLLLDAGADPSAKANKASLLSRAVEDGRRADCAVELLRRGCDVTPVRPRVYQFASGQEWEMPNTAETAADVCLSSSGTYGASALGSSHGYRPASFLKVMGALVRRGAPFSPENVRPALRVMPAVLKHIENEDRRRTLGGDPAAKERRRILEQEDFVNLAFDWKDAKAAEHGVEVRLARVRELEEALGLAAGEGERDESGDGGGGEGEENDDVDNDDDDDDDDRMST
jgi:ankyrin repeat protein